MSATTPVVVQMKLWTRARDVWKASESSRTSRSSRGPSQRVEASCPSEEITCVSSGLSGASLLQEKQNYWRIRQARRKKKKNPCALACQARDRVVKAGDQQISMLKKSRGSHGTRCLHLARSCC